MDCSIIELQGLTKCYGSKKVVDNLNLNIKKGEIFGLLGPNGAGKTTTILMLLGLIEPTTGIAKVCGYNSIKNPIKVKTKVGYMPDNIGFYDQMTGLENLIYIGQLNGFTHTQAKEVAGSIMNSVGLGRDLHTKTAAYSKGMKQRLGLADVLIKQPEIIILDEPTLGIDPSGVKEFLLLIKRLSQQHGLTVILSSHHLNHVQQVCDRVGIFVNGNLLVQGNIEELSNKLFSDSPYQVDLKLQQPISQPWAHKKELLQLRGVTKVNVNHNEVNISCKEQLTSEIVNFMVSKNYDIIGVQQKQYGLEDIYQVYFENQSENL